MLKRRSREGAWIEIIREAPKVKRCSRRSREGAWIEITTPQGNLAAYGVAPARERGLKYALTQ